jgi:hypothetical protein
MEKLQVEGEGVILPDRRVGLVVNGVVAGLIEIVEFGRQVQRRLRKRFASEIFGLGEQPLFGKGNSIWSGCVACRWNFRSDGLRLRGR